MSTWRKFVLFGDSITQYAFQPHGWGSAISDVLQRKADVFNRGFSGYNTDNAFDMLTDVFPAGSLKATDAVTIFFGANDAVLSGFPQHVPIQRYETNLQKIVDYFIEIGLSPDRIILISPPALNEKGWLKYCMSQYKEEDLNRKNDVTRLYAEACERTAATKSCLFVNTWKNFMEEEEYDKFLCDGLHLSDLGSKRVASLLLPHVMNITSSWEENYPDWKEIKH